MDETIAECLALRRLEPALTQPGAFMARRAPYEIVEHLRRNLDQRLNRSGQAFPQHARDLTLLVTGWEFGGRRRRRPMPFSCTLERGPIEADGNRYLKLRYTDPARFFRRYPRGLLIRTFGDDGGDDEAIGKALQALGAAEGVTHDDVERLLSLAISERSTETKTVSRACLAVQLDPFAGGRHVAATYYPNEHAANGHPLISPLVVTWRMICSPSVVTSAYGRPSRCGNYVEGGFTDGVTGLGVLTRLPVEMKEPPRTGLKLKFAFQPRPSVRIAGR